MKTTKGIKVCGWLGLCFSALLAAATIWAYSSFRTSFGSIARVLHESVLSVSNALDQVASTTKARVDVAGDTIQLLRSSRKLVQNLQAASAKQATLLPKHAASIKAVADRTYEFSGTAIVAGDVLAVEIPTGIKFERLMPTLVMGSPLYAASQKLKAIGQEGVGLGLSLEALAASLNGEALAITASFADSCAQTLRLIDSLEKAATAVKDEHLPQALIAMERAKGTLREVNDQAEVVNQLGVALVLIGLLLAAVGGALSFGIMRIAKTLEGVKT